MMGSTREMDGIKHEAASSESQPAGDSPVRTPWWGAQCAPITGAFLTQSCNIISLRSAEK